MITVLVVEDQHALASALEVAIGAQPDLECVGATGTVADALDRVTRSSPDVVLMDIELPGTDGIEGTRQIKASHPEVSVLVLTAGATPGRLAAAAAAGAAGFLTKDSSFPDILAAIRNPASGKMMIEGSALMELIAGLGVAPQAGDIAPATGQAAAGQASQGPASQGPAWARLTSREREVLALMGEGLDPRAIAERLVVSLHTARGHVKSVLMKLGAHSQLEAVVTAIRSGVLPAGGPRPGDAPRRSHRARPSDAPHHLRGPAGHGRTI